MKNYLLFIVSFCWAFFISCGNNGGSGSFGNTTAEKQSVDTTSQPTVSNEKNIKADFNIYIENSGSMNGYVTGNTDFKNTLMALIADLKTRDVAKSVNIYYINQTTCPQKINATTNDIQQFFLNLNAQSFQNSGCGTTTSYIPDIIHKSISEKPDDVNILISDFIFSDKAGTSQQYLELAKNTLVMDVSEQLKKQDFSTIFAKYSSKFNGKYFMESQRPNVLDVSGKGIHRPYYLLITGKNAALYTFVEKINFRNYSGYNDSYFLFIPKNSQPPSKLVRTSKKGEFDIVQPATKMIIANAAAVSGENYFQFSFAANLSSFKMENNFLTDKTNYQLPENSEIVSIEKINDNNNESLKGYTHLFTIATTDLKQKQDISVKLTSGVPSWVAQSSTLNDGNPADSLQQQQTFGLKFLVDGIAQAYKNTFSDKDQFTINIQVNKNAANGGGGSSSSFIWWIIVLAVAVIGVFIFLKSKK